MSSRARQGPDPADPEPIRVLLVDDDEDDYVLTRDLLGEIPDAHFRLAWEPDERRALERMSRSEDDLYLIDYRLGRTTGLELIRQARLCGCSGPMILLTGLGERALDYAAMRAGAADYLEKGKLDAALLERSIRYSLQQKRHADDLERKVRERTAALARANEALEAEISERRRVEEALREVDRQKDRFLATLAHELRNPLVPIRNALEIIRLAGYRPEVVETNRAMMERQVKQMVRLIDDLLDISRISQGKITLQAERVRLHEVVENAVEGSRPLIEGAGHTLVVDLPEPPAELEADPTRLAQIILNLLNNAAKYTETGGHIELRARLDDAHLVLSVSDNGVGIPPDLLPIIFEMYAQIHRPAELTQGGLGVGLSLVRSLALLHGGTVEARSEGAGRGATFTVTLPRHRLGPPPSGTTLPT